MPPFTNEMNALILIARQVREARRSRGPGPLQEYKGKEYFVGAWEGPGTTYEQAVQLAKDPLTLHVILTEGLGLEYILADRHATAGLKQALIKKDPLVLRGLADSFKSEKPKRKPGPRPKDGIYRGECSMDLHLLGLTNGQVANIIYPYDSPAIGRARVAANLAQVRKKEKKASTTR